MMKMLSKIEEDDTFACGEGVISVSFATNLQKAGGIFLTCIKQTYLHADKPTIFLSSFKILAT